MANAIKYSESVVPLTLRKGDFYLLTGNEIFGTTSATGFWNGYEFTNAKYVIYLNRPSNGPSIYAPVDDNELIAITNKIANTNYSTASECIAWFATQSDKMIVNKTYPPLVTDGSILSTDASFLPSYPTQGTSFYDLSGNNNTGTLVNGPTFAPNGYFIFDGTDDWVNFGSSGASLIQGKTNITIGLLFQSNTNLVLRSLFGTLRYGCGANLGLVSSFNNLVFYNDYGPWPATGGTCNAVGFSNYVVPDTWIYAVATYDGVTTKLYAIKQGALSVATSTAKSGTTNVFAYNLEIGRGGFGQFLNGRVSNAFIYDRTLTQQEIFQNYYQAPIVTDGLVLAFDAGNLVSYESGSGTTINDLTSYNNNGTLINGVGFSNQGVPRFILDGTNDRIDVPKDLNGFEHNIQYDINWTIECWMYMYTPDASPQTYKGIYGNYSGCNYSVYPGNAQGFIIFNAGNPATVFTNFGFGPKSPSGCPDGVTWNNSESSWVYNLAINKWCHWVMTSDDGTNYKIYVNGVQRGSTKTFDFKNSASRTANNLTSTRNYSWGGSFTSNEANEIDFSCMRMYNRPLSTSEVSQNFNAQRSRFGI